MFLLSIREVLSISIRALAMGYVPRIAVVGGGVSGLVLGKELASRGLHATVFDTGEHACGGRASSREASDGKGRRFSFDHSTQYMTCTKGSRFEAMAQSWAKEGLLAEWPADKVGTLKDGSFTPFDDGVIRYIGAGGLRPLADFLAEGSTEVVRPQWVGAMTPIGGEGPKRRWELASGPRGKALGTFDFVAISHNGKCALRLAETAKLPDGSPAAAKTRASLQCAFGARPTEELKKQRKLILSSVWALMFAVDTPLDVPNDMEGAHVVGSEVVSWASNTTAKRQHGGVRTDVDGGETQCWVVHSTPQFARDNKCPQEAIPKSVADSVAAAMMKEFERCASLEPGSVKPVFTKVQLWGAANPLTAAGVPAVFDSETRSGACGDWCSMGPPSVEAASESAIALADAIEATFSPTTARDPEAAGRLDAAKVRWTPCSGDAAALGAFPGTKVPSMGEIAAAPRREGGGGRGGRGGRGRGGGRGAGRGGRGQRQRGGGRGGRGRSGAGVSVAAVAAVAF